MGKISTQPINEVMSLLLHVIDTIWLKSGMGKGLEHRGNISYISVKARTFLVCINNTYKKRTILWLIQAQRRVSI